MSWVHRWRIPGPRFVEGFKMKRTCSKVIRVIVSLLIAVPLAPEIQVRRH